MPKISTIYFFCNQGMQQLKTDFFNSKSGASKPPVTRSLNFRAKMKLKRDIGTRLFKLFRWRSDTKKESTIHDDWRSHHLLALLLQGVNGLTIDEILATPDQLPIDSKLLNKIVPEKWDYLCASYHGQTRVLYEQTLTRT